jgi:CRISPR-associated endonuclease Csn1
MSSSNRILGLDLGTNSIGWAIVDKEGSEFSLIDKGARIFSEGVKSEKGVESSRAAERTDFRSARKIKFRRKLRKYETLKVLSENNMCPLSIEEVIAWRKSGFKNYPLNPEFISWLRTSEEDEINPYLFRDKASRKKVALFELGRAFYHIAQRRGFLSNRLDQSAEGIIEQNKPGLEDIIYNATSFTELQIELTDYFQDRDLIERKAPDLDEGEKKLKTIYNSFLKTIKDNPKDFDKTKTLLSERLNKKEDLGVVKQKIGEISQAMIVGNFKTLGQYFFSLYNKGKIRNQYTARDEHYLSEFEVICLAQGIEGIIATEILPEKRYVGLAKELYKAIFFQRPLKSQKGSIGKCTFEKSKSRCAVSHPDFEEYRMWSFVNTIKIKPPTDESWRFLTREEIVKIIPKFLRKKDNFNFEDIAKELVPSGGKYLFSKVTTKGISVDYLFNYHLNSSVSGCVVSTSFKNALGDDWKTKIYTYETRNKRGENVTRNVDYNDLWHLISVSTSDLYLQEFALTKLKLDNKKATLFSKIKLKKDFASLSLTAINKINPFLREGLLYSHAVFMANIENIVDADIWNNLEDRKYIQTKIAALISTNTFDNNLLEIINGLIKECKTGGHFYSKEAENIYKSDLDKKVSAFVVSNKIEDQKESIIGMLFPIFIEQLKKYEFISIKRLDEKVFDFLDGQNDDGQVFCNSKNKLKKLYHPSDIEVFKKKIIKNEFGNEKVVLGSPLTSSIKNPMAMRALHQLRKVLNTLISEGQIDHKTIIHIEMARELNDANKRKGIQDYQKEIENNRKVYIEEIKSLYKAATSIDIEPTEDDILRYQLWMEQDKKTIYEEQCTNISISQIIGSNPDFDIEHTIPRSRSQDNSQMNKTLCSKYVNREIKKNKIPFELNNHCDILVRVEPWQMKYKALENEIISLSKSIKAATTKEQKDRKIRLRHKLNLQKEYFKGKYERFTDKEPKVGFKNSQIPDTGIITKYSQAYLKSYFKRVESVKGGMVAEFRKIWGIQESYQENNKKYYHEKDRSKHTHHTIDAITIACMTKEKYDILANAWTHEDKGQLGEARKLLADSKPWLTFTEDLKKVEDEILVSHHTPDNVKKQSKKIVRIRGKKQFRDENVFDKKGNTIPIFGKRLNEVEISSKIEGKDYFKIQKNNETVYYEYLFDKIGNIIHKKIPFFNQGDTIRGTLHQDSIYGAIKSPLNQEEIRYVIRKDLESIKASDVENIVDEVVKDKVKEAISAKVLLLSSNPQQKNKLDGKVWMNEEKGIAINKVRLYANSVKNPLHVKEHALLSKSKHEHKQKVYAQNDENYCMAIYELDGKRDFELINNFNLAKLQKQGQGYYPLFKEKIANGRVLQIPIAKRNNRDLVLKRGKQVIFYDKEVENPDDVNDLVDLKGRIYIIEGLSIQRINSSGNQYDFGVIMFRYFKEARKSEDLKHDKYKPDGIFKLDESKPTRKMNHNQFNAFVEGIDFKVLSSGKIEKL